MLEQNCTGAELSRSYILPLQLYVYIHPGPMNGLIARVSALPYKSTVFHTNFVNAVAGAINPFMGRGCSLPHL